MLFTQIEFLIFLTAVMTFLFTVKNHMARKVVLLIGSYYFYAYWDWRFLSLIIISTAVDYIVGGRLDKTDNVQHRKVLLFISLFCNLGLLFFFKYYNFFIESLQETLTPLFPSANFKTLAIILPIGISFYTFQTLSYTIDIYRRKIKHTDNLLDFALFVAFFPQLVAGPIVRAVEFLPQLKEKRDPSRSRIFAGTQQFLFGFFKKVFIADKLSYFVDEAFANPGAFDCSTTWLAVICYAIQIYCDFSGYSDMAIGTARMLGYDFNVNFNHPYTAVSLDDFWRRWHISLSSWLRDYLYIPLGGNRKGRRRTYINLMLVMLLGGLWHGASWNFVIWGAIHGGGLAITKFARELNNSKNLLKNNLLNNCIGWTATMFFVLTAWVFFRSSDGGTTQALLILKQMFTLGEGVSWLYPFAGFAIPFIIFTHIWNKLKGTELRCHMPADKWYTAAISFGLIWLLIIFPSNGFQPFIYFQF
ncbi:MAG: MBOAT family O-acyltransferase [Planctomycetota bacterium]|jgi:alginate O-acetyltransferase complex protein AlgI